MKAGTKRVRINITLPRERVGLIDRVRGTTNRSRFIDNAVTHYVGSSGRSRLRKLLEEDGLQNRERDLQMVEEWAAVDAEAWQGKAKK